MPDTVQAPAAAATAPVRARRGAGETARRYGLRAVALAYVLILVAVPVFVVLWRTIRDGLGSFVDALTTPDAVHAFQLTGEVVLISVVCNTLFGVGVALLLARYRFFGKRALDLLLDLPVSVSPIVVGLALILVWGTADGWFGNELIDANIQVIFSTPGIVLATVFVALPLVVREVLPVLIEAGTDQELAARSLGASAWQRFWRITLPTIRWGLAYGVVLCLARSLGEFGAVKVVSGNISGQTQTLTLLVDTRAELNENGYYPVALVLIAVSVVCITIITALRPKEEKH